MISCPCAARREITCAIAVAATERHRRRSCYTRKGIGGITASNRDSAQKVTGAVCDPCHRHKRLRFVDLHAIGGTVTVPHQVLASGGERQRALITRCATCLTIGAVDAAAAGVVAPVPSDGDITVIPAGKVGRWRLAGVGRGCAAVVDDAGQFENAIRS